MKQKLLNLSLLLFCLIAGVSSAWANPGDEIKSPSDVVSGKAYYIKGVYTSSKVDYTVYYGPTENDQKNQKVQSAPVTDKKNAMPITFTKVAGGWTLTTPNGNYIRPHSSNGQTYFVEGEILLQLTSGDTKEGTGKGIKIGPWNSEGSTDNWYIQSNKTSAKIGAYKNTQYDVTLIEAGDASGKTTTSLSFGEGSPFEVNLGESFTAPTLSATPSSILSSVTYTSSATSVAEVNSTTGAVTIKGLGTTTIKAQYEGDDDYLASNAEYVINVVDPNAKTATFDLSANQYGWDATSDGNVYFDGSTYTPAVEGDITLSVFGNVRMWGTTTSSLRLYGDNVGTSPNIYTYGRGAITLKAAAGFVITSVKFEGSSLTFSSSEETYTTPTWEGEANEIIFEKGSNTPQIKTITVSYKSVPEPTTATITLSSACTDGSHVYGTYSNSSAWVVPGNLTVSEVCIAGGELAIYSYKEGDIVPANAGVMVAAETGGDYSVALTTATASESPSKGNNCLIGTGDSGITETDMAKNDTEFFRLTMHNGETIGFFWGAENGAAFDLGANKAYLAVATDNLGLNAGSAKRLWITNGTDGINNVSTNVENNVIYNLNGQRVSNATKGLYIKNGQKYFVK